MNPTFCKVVLIYGIIDILAHILLMSFILMVFFPPITRYMQVFMEPSYNWTVFYALMYYFTYCQFFLCAYIAFIRFILIYFPFKGTNILMKSFWLFVVLLLITSYAPTWHLWFCKTYFGPIDKRYTNGYLIFAISYKKLEWMNVSNSKNSIIHYFIFLILSFILNLMSLVKLIFKNLFSSVGKKKSVKGNVNENTPDMSIYHICQKLRVYVYHLMCLLQPYTLILLSKSTKNILKSIIINSFKTRHQSKSYPTGELFYFANQIAKGIYIIIAL
uniref:Serpentine receptor class gamma n=1 Tax=Strongyloides venezuelensis TaxID=75913 RepID=A0A0K0G5D2_STRVS